jgi:hypothetical protein
MQEELAEQAQQLGEQSEVSGPIPGRMHGEVQAAARYSADQAAHGSGLRHRPLADVVVQPGSGRSFG